MEVSLLNINCANINKERVRKTEEKYVVKGAGTACMTGVRVNYGGSKGSKI